MKHERHDKEARDARKEKIYKDESKEINEDVRTKYKYMVKDYYSSFITTNNPV